MMQTRSNWLPVAGLVAAMVLWASSFIVLKLAFRSYHPMVVIFSRIPVSQASAFVNLIPVFTVLLGWLILGEQFTPSQYLAALLILTGIFISQDRPVSTFRPRTLRNQNA